MMNRTKNTREQESLQIYWTFLRRSSRVDFWTEWSPDCQKWKHETYQQTEGPNKVRYGETQALCASLAKAL